MSEKLGPLDIPELVKSIDVPSWEYEVDVAIIGQGIAGTCAALEAHRAGANVLVIERASGGGGASAMSSGIFYLGGGTEVQSACGYDDSPDEMANFLMASCDPLDPSAVRAFADDCPDHFRWLEAQGVPFERSSFKGKAVYLLTTECLMFTGNEKLWPFSEVAKPAPRGHKCAGAGENAGIAAMTPLLARCEEEGIGVIYDSAAIALVQDENGRIMGVKVRQQGRTFFVKTRKAVIIAAGSHNLNTELIARHIPEMPESAIGLGIPSNDGMGVRLGISAGAMTSAMDGLIPTGSIYPPAQLIKGIIVNKLGQRFVAEDSYHGRSAMCIKEQPDQKAYLIVDSDIFAYPEMTAHQHRLIDGYETIEEMEAGLELPSGSLCATLERYNSDARSGVDRFLHKASEWLKSLDQGPYAAFDISFDSSVYFFITLGGIRTGMNGEALGIRGEAIPGLYVVGASAAHIPRTGKAYASGLSLGPGSYFGRRAGRHAAMAK